LQPIFCIEIFRKVSFRIQPAFLPPSLGAWFIFRKVTKLAINLGDCNFRSFVRTLCCNFELFSSVEMGFYTQYDLYICAFVYVHVYNRVASWYIFKPKIQILESNERCW
jgi:hypothetical protein